MISVVKHKLQTFRRIWREEGSGEAASLLGASIHWALCRRLHPHRLVKRHIKALKAPMLLDPQDVGLSRTLFYRGIHEPLATQIAKEELTEGMTVIDVGSNLGYYVLLEAGQIGSQGRLFAIEPVPRTFAILEQNIALNQIGNASAENLAMSSESAELTMNVTEQFNWAHIPQKQMNSNRAKDMSRWVRETISVRGLTLDDFVQSRNIECVNFLRMDTEGYETEIIKGAANVLATHRPLKILMEVHPFLSDDIGPFAEMLSFLYEKGLRVKYVGYKTEIIYRWPSLEQVVRYLGQEEFGPAPHLLLTSERPPSEIDRSQSEEIGT